VKSSQFKMVASTPLDDQVDAQPLVVSNETIQGQGTHDVVYVATESNTIYAIDAATGTVLLSRNLGTPVPYTALPGQCGNNGPNVGINSTPVIDVSANVMYVIAYTYESNHQIFRIHKLDLTTLNDAISPVVVAASATLTNGTTYNFNPFASRQRSALLLANGNVYAGFASFCDIAADQSRGWILGWQAGSLTPFASNQLNNKLAHSPDSFYLTSIWMSGDGVAAGASGDIYFVTGNSDYSGTTFNAINNITESVAQVSSDLTQLKSLFTPSNWAGLDQTDADFGSGGIVLIPPQPGAITDYAAAAGKAGVLYLMDAKKLGGKNGMKPRGSVNIGACWCGQSYFTGSDGAGRIVGSGSTHATIWRIKVNAKGKEKLVFDGQTPAMVSGQDPGFFTSISSNGTTPGSAVIWAVSHPTNNNPANVSLYAFDGTSGVKLFSAVAGTWPNTGGNSNIVPTVANGMVYVASNQSLTIFGLSNGPGAKLSPAKPAVDMRPKLAAGEHEVYGTAKAINGTLITVQKRDGKQIVVDFGKANAAFKMAEPSVGHGLIARGTLDQAGMMHASAILHAKDQPGLWPADR